MKNSIAVILIYFKCLLKNFRYFYLTIPISSLINIPRDIASGKGNSNLFLYNSKIRYYTETGDENNP